MSAERLLVAVLAFAAGVVAMDIAGDFQQAEREAGLALERAFYLAAQRCSPTTRHQVAVQRWEGGRLVCALHDNVGYGRAPRLASRKVLPAPPPGE